MKENDNKNYYEAYDDRYKQVHEKSLKWFSNKNSQIVEDTINKYKITKGMKILEVGCGEGRDAIYLLKKGYDLLASDISPTAVDYCKKNYPEKLQSFIIINCLTDRLNEKYDFIYSISVLHMFVLDEHRIQFYRFIYEQLAEKGIALICIQGDGKSVSSSDITNAFELQAKIHATSNQPVLIAGTSYRKIDFEGFYSEIVNNQLIVIESGITSIEPDYSAVMYAIVKRTIKN